MTHLTNEPEINQKQGPLPTTPIARKMIKVHTTCCHSCKISNTTKLHDFISCGGCPKIFCRTCFSKMDWIESPSWQEAKRNSADWLCPACLGICNCTRCSQQKEERELTVRMKNPLSAPWNFNCFAPQKVRRLKFPKDHIEQKLQELRSREKLCDDHIDEIQRLIQKMQQEKDQVAKNKDILDSATIQPLPTPTEVPSTS